MSAVRRNSTLTALSHVKDLRKSLAEAEYLRRRRQQRDLRQRYIEHEQSLDLCKSRLPQQKADIMAELAKGPVDLREIHNAHASVRKLYDRLDAMAQEHTELEQRHRQACDDKDQAHRHLACATRRLEKFQTMRSLNGAQIARQADEHEQLEMEDLPATASPLSTSL